MGTFHAVIDRKYLLCDIADAYRYVETEQKTGIVVIEVVPEDGWTQFHRKNRGPCNSK